MGQRQRQADAARLDSAPACGQVPQQQRQADLEPGLGGDRALHVEVAGPALDPAQQGLGQLRPRPDAVREGAVEHREARRHQRPPLGDAGDQVVRLDLVGLEQVARAEQLGGDPIADPDADREHAVEHEQAGSVGGPRQTLGQLTSPASASKITAVAAGRATSRIRTSSASARSMSRSSR